MQNDLSPRWRQSMNSNKYAKFLELKNDATVLKLENPDKYRHELDTLLKNNYVSYKCDRLRRIPEHLLYIEKLGKELLENQLENQLVIDIGPGPGEFLEICRFLGYRIKGYDAPLNQSEMGDEYVLFSSYMAECQNLDIEYIGFENLISKLPFENNSVFFINSRGSIEQVFKDHLIGVPHRVHKKSSYLCWKIDDNLKEEIKIFLKEVERVLQAGGIFLIRGNGAMNTREFDNLLREIIATMPSLYLDEDYTFENRLHKIIKREIF